MFLANSARLDFDLRNNATAYAQSFFYIEKYVHQLLEHNPLILWWLSPLCFVLGYLCIDFFLRELGDPAFHRFWPYMKWEN
jgi:hypothetical protein